MGSGFKVSGFKGWGFEGLGNQRMIGLNWLSRLVSTYIYMYICLYIHTYIYICMYLNIYRVREIGLGDVGFIEMLGLGVWVCRLSKFGSALETAKK